MIRVDLPGLSVTNELGQTVPYLQEIQGWYDSAESVIDADDYAQGEGSHDATPRIRPRFINVVIGFTAVGNPAAVFELNDIAMAMQELLDPFELPVTDPLGTRYALVRIAGRIENPIVDERGVASITVPLKARDPKKYGPFTSPAPSTGLPQPGGGIAYPIAYPIDYGAPGDPGRVVVSNPGTSVAIPDLVVNGGLGGGFDLSTLETPDRIRFERVIPDGSAVTVHQSENQASIDGDTNIVSTYLTLSDLIVIPPKGFVTIQFNSIGAVTGTPRLSALERPAYR